MTKLGDEPAFPVATVDGYCAHEVSETQTCTHGISMATSCAQCEEADRQSIKHRQEQQSTIAAQQQTIARLEALTVSQFGVIEQAYTVLGDIRNQWPRRNSEYGQGLLIALLDAICAHTGRDRQEAQDDYCNRLLAAQHGLRPPAAPKEG